MVTLETGGSGTATPAPAPAFGGGLFGAPKPAENKDAPKPGRYEFDLRILCVDHI